MVINVKEQLDSVVAMVKLNNLEIDIDVSDSLKGSVYLFNNNKLLINILIEFYENIESYMIIRRQYFDFNRSIYYNEKIDEILNEIMEWN